RILKRYLPLIALALVIACKRQETAPPAGDPSHGKQLIDQYGCTTCHIIPGLEGPKGMIGPSLQHVAIRPLLAGKVPNSPATMTQYIQNPQAADPQNSMPNLGVKEDEARDITAYLQTLK
ncbi:MAG TPA: c-type cytochrome, partial [Thermoanaerobaculia bacterium]|nr:c-type cytochrome [Thermoanaerobaculia bacterium]